MVVVGIKPRDPTPRGPSYELPEPIDLTNLNGRRTYFQNCYLTFDDVVTQS